MTYLKIWLIKFKYGKTENKSNTIQQKENLHVITDMDEFNSNL